MSYLIKSVTSFKVGSMARLKKLMTAEWKRSFSAGNRLKACRTENARRSRVSARAWSRSRGPRLLRSCLDPPYLALLQLGKDAEQLVVDHLNALKGGLLKSLDLQAHEHLERLPTDEQRRRGALMRHATAGIARSTRGVRFLLRAL